MLYKMYIIFASIILHVRFSTYAADDNSFIYVSNRFCINTGSNVAWPIATNAPFFLSGTAASC